ncbi:hypothetical protein [Hydrogenimonas sp.]
MFSSLKNQKKAEELIEEARRLIAETDDRARGARERLERTVAEIDKLRNHLSKNTLKRFHDLFFRIEGAEPIELVDVPERPFSAQAEELTERLDAVEPVEIGGAKRGKLSAVFGSLSAALVTLVVAVVVAAVATGVPLDPQTLQSPDTARKILTWIGGGAFGYADASPLFGGVGLAAAVLAAGLIVWSILMAKSSGNNLAEAKNSFADAQTYHERKEHYISAMDALSEALERLGEILETIDIFMQEDNAVLRRILHTEGRDFQRYKEGSKERVVRAAHCAEAVAPMLSITIVTSEGEPSEQLTDTLQKGSLYRDALVAEEPLPERESAASKEKKEEEKPSLAIETGESL